MKSAWGLEIYSQEKVVFRSKKPGVKGLLDFIKKHKRHYKNLIIFDKKVGRGVALFAAYLKASEVYGNTGSKLAAKVLRECKIKFYFSKTIPYILNKQGNGLCPIEKLSIDKTPEKFYNCLVR